MDVRVLGPVEVDTDGITVAIDAPKERAILAQLALRVGRTVGVEELVQAVWGERPPRTALKTLRSHVSRLRGALTDLVIITDASGYRLAIPPDDVDVHRFEQLAAAGRRELDAGDPVRALPALDEALGLWRGTPLTDLADGPLRAGQLARLDELRLMVEEASLDAHLALGDDLHVVAAGRALVERYPLREKFWGQLMLALHRAGRRGEALAEYARLRDVLREELGVGPSAELRELQAGIVLESPRLDLRPASPRRSLPSPLTSFVGREQQISEVRKLLHSHRLVTLLGPGGVGKTRLAIEVADEPVERWPDGVWWADLATVVGPDAMVSHLANSLHLGSSPGMPALDSVRSFLRPRELLLVIDNADRLTGPLGRQLAELLETAPGVAALVTSRLPLGIEGEQRYVVPPLELPDTDDDIDAESVRLFLDRLAGRGRSLPPPEDRRDVNRLCRLVDGLPLGIELLAARAASTKVGDLLHQLEDRRSVLDQEVDRRSERHGSLRAVLDSTVELLEPSDRRLLGRLSVFPGRFDLAAVRSVAAGNDPLPSLARLIDAGLVTLNTNGDEVVGYRLPDLTREYADSLLTPEERADVRRRHAHHYADLARRAGAEMEDAGEPQWLSALHREDHNVRAAIDWWFQNDPTGAVCFAAAVGRAWFVWGNFEETCDLLRTMIREAGPVTPDNAASLGWAHLRLAWPLFLTGDVSGAVEHLAVAEALLESAEDLHGLAMTLAGRAHMTLLFRGDAEAARGDYERALGVSRRAGAVQTTAWIEAEAAQALILADRADDGVDAMLDDAEAAFEASGDHLGLGHVYMDRVLMAYALDDLDGLERMAQIGIRHCDSAGNRMYEQILVTARGVRRVHLGELDEAAELLREAARLASDDRNMLQLGIAFQALAVHAAVSERHHLAASLWGAASSLGPVWPLFQRRYGELLSPTRRMLGREFEQEVASGALLDAGTALTLALADIDQPVVRSTG